MLHILVQDVGSFLRPILGVPKGGLKWDPKGWPQIEGPKVSSLPVLSSFSACSAGEERSTRGAEYIMHTVMMAESSGGWMAHLVAQECSSIIYILDCSTASSMLRRYPGPRRLHVVGPVGSCHTFCLSVLLLCILSFILGC